MVTECQMFWGEAQTRNVSSGYTVGLSVEASRNTEALRYHVRPTKAEYLGWL